MYKNIKVGNLTFPDDVSVYAQQFIKKLMNKNPNLRLGVRDKTEIQNDPFFKGIDWQKVVNKEYQPPFMDFDDDDEDILMQAP